MSNFENVVTPWGRSQVGMLLCEGIKQYYTAWHGGLKVMKKLNDQIPLVFRNLDGWYEEYCAYIIPYYFFFDKIKEYFSDKPEAFAKVSSKTAEAYFLEFNKEYALKVLERHFTGEYIIHFGKELSEECKAELRLTGDDIEKLKDKVQKCLEVKNITVGDIIIFSSEVHLRRGGSFTTFIYRGNSLFDGISTYGWVPVNIPGWRQGDFSVVKQGTELHTRLITPA